MMTKTHELIGAALDYAVALCEGVFLHPVIQAHGKLEIHFSQENGCEVYSPSTDWSIGGLIVERELISLETWNVRCKDGAYRPRWWATKKMRHAFQNYQMVPTTFDARGGDEPLVAAMRCHVASRLGAEVDIPEELLS